MINSFGLSFWDGCRLRIEMNMIRLQVEQYVY